MQIKTSIGFLAIALALAGCDGGGAGCGDGVDSGVIGASDSGGGGGACASARAVTLTEGEQTITGDTTGMSVEDVPLGFCEYGPSPQELLAVTIPGTGTKRLGFSMLTGNTEGYFDTVVQVRPAGCDSVTDALCFDEDLWSLDGVPSEEWFLAEGGSTIYVVVKGAPDESVTYFGPWSMTVEVTDANPPTLTGAEVLRVGPERYDFFIDGGDVDGDATALEYTFLDADGADIAMASGQNPLLYPTQTTFSDVLARVANEPEILTAAAGATQVRIRVVDETELASEPMTLTIREVTEAAPGGACSADVICPAEYACAGGTCEIPADTATFCGAATALTLTPGTPVTVNGTIEPGDSRLEPSCLADDLYLRSAEDAYTVVVPEVAAPAIAYDLVASTRDPAVDTVVYVRGDCADPATEEACNDDVDFSRDMEQSEAVVERAPAGTHTVVVEFRSGWETETHYELDVLLRPLLDSGATCDPDGLMNRCADGPCRYDSMICP